MRESAFTSHKREQPRADTICWSASHDEPNCKIESGRRAAEGGTVSGQREAAMLVDAVNWKDRVIDDLRSEQGRLSAREHQVSVKLIGEVAALIASNIASGEVLSLADSIRRALSRNELSISARQAGRVAKFLEARGHAASLRVCFGRPNFVVPHRTRAEAHKGENAKRLREIVAPLYRPSVSRRSSTTRDFHTSRRQMAGNPSHS